MTRRESGAIDIRPVRPDDVQEIVRIYIRSWNVGFGTLMPAREITADLVSRWAQDLARPFPHRWWVAVADATVAGFAGIGPSRDPIDPSIGELDTIAVDPVLWRTGIGRGLMSVALKHLISDGYRKAVLWTLANYERGQRFYEAMGWKADGAVRDHGRQICYRHELAR